VHTRPIWTRYKGNYFDETEEKVRETYSRKQESVSRSARKPNKLEMPPQVMKERLGNNKGPSRTPTKKMKVTQACQVV
jgi:hypothetical protein